MSLGLLMTLHRRGDIISEKDLRRTSTSDEDDHSHRRVSEPGNSDCGGGATDSTQNHPNDVGGHNSRC